jgi:hypothetical protein
MITVRQLIAELEERDLEMPVEVAGGEIVDIEYTDNGKLRLIGEDEV